MKKNNSIALGKLLSYNLIVSVLLPIICLVAFQLMSIKDDSIHYLLSY